MCENIYKIITLNNIKSMLVSTILPNQNVNMLNENRWTFRLNGILMYFVCSQSYFFQYLYPYRLNGWYYLEPDI